MEYVTTLTTSGQITIPKALRELIGVKKSDKLILKYDAKSNHVYFEKPYTLEDMIKAFDRIQTNFPPKTKKAIKENADKTADELFEQAWNSPREVAYRKEKYGL